jgi:hypothetical protein
MKLINSQVESENNQVPKGNCYFISPNTFGLYRIESGGVKIRYFGEMTQIGERYEVAIRKQDEIVGNSSAFKFSLPYRNYHEEDSDIFCHLVLANLNELSPLADDEVTREMPDWAKYALRALAVVIAVQVGSCIRKNYQIEEAIRQEAASSSGK